MLPPGTPCHRAFPLLSRQPPPCCRLPLCSHRAGPSHHRSRHFTVADESFRLVPDNMRSWRKLRASRQDRQRLRRFPSSQRCRGERHEPGCLSTEIYPETDVADPPPDRKPVAPAAASLVDQDRGGDAESAERRPVPLQRRAPLAPLAAWRLAKVRNYIEAEISSRLRLVDMARVAGLSRMHFAAQFREAKGRRPHDYVLMRRIERAKRLITEQELAMVEIALYVGFQSQAHFCTIFKALTGTTPTLWRAGLCSRLSGVSVDVAGAAPRSYRAEAAGRQKASSRHATLAAARAAPLNVMARP